MDLKSQMELIDALIEEKEDYTIMDFLELKGEIEAIEGTKVLYSDAEIKLIKVKKHFNKIKYQYYQHKKAPAVTEA